MFAPEIYVKDTKTFMDLYGNAKVRLYSIQHVYDVILKLQCFDGVCVYTHSPQDYDYKEQSFTVLGSTLKIPEKDNEEKYMAWKQRKNEALEAFIRDVVKTTKDLYGAIEGEFVSVSLIAQEE